jgi:hypothetical protein
MRLVGRPLRDHVMVKAESQDTLDAAVGSAVGEATTLRSEEAAVVEAPPPNGPAPDPVVPSIPVKQADAVMASVSEDLRTGEAAAPDSPPMRAPPAGETAQAKAEGDPTPAHAPRVADLDAQIAMQADAAIASEGVEPPAPAPAQVIETAKEPDKKPEPPAPKLDSTPKPTPQVPQATPPIPRAAKEAASAPAETAMPADEAPAQAATRLRERLLAPIERVGAPFAKRYERLSPRRQTVVQFGAAWACLHACLIWGWLIFFRSTEPTVAGVAMESPAPATQNGAGRTEKGPAPDGTPKGTSAEAGAQGH